MKKKMLYLTPNSHKTIFKENFKIIYGQRISILFNYIEEVGMVSTIRDKIQGTICNLGPTLLLFSSARK